MNKYQVRQLPLTIAISSTLVAGSLQAATITVDIANDAAVGTFPYYCSLRAAITAANTDAAVDGCAAGEPGLDQIVFDATLNESIITIAEPESPFVISDSVEIAGPVAGEPRSISISGNNFSRVLDIAGSTPGSIDVSLSNLRILSGFVDIGFDDERSGGIASENANLSLSDCYVVGNYAYSGDGGIGFSNGALTLDKTLVGYNGTGYFGSGGGVSVTSGDLSVTGGQITQNLSYYGGSGVLLRLNSTASFNNARVTNNQASSYFGGVGVGISAQATELILTDSTIRGNVSVSGGSGAGIAAFSSQVTVIDSEISYNSLGYYLLGNETGGGIALSGSTLTMENSALSRNYADSYYANGGGLGAYSSTVEIRSSLISNNFARSTAPIDGDNGGGAIFMTGGEMTIRDSEISANRVTGDYQRAAFGRFVNHDLSLVNVTISGHEMFSVNLLGPDAGSVLDLAGTSTAELIHVTLADNVDAFGDRVNIFRGIDASLTLTQSILSSATGAPICSAAADSVTVSLATDASCTGTATDPVDLALVPLADNGGPTRTHALALTSVALDAGGDCATDLGVLTDQRGAPRDAQCDLGAFEFVDSIFLDRFQALMP